MMATSYLVAEAVYFRKKSRAVSACSQFLSRPILPRVLTFASAEGILSKEECKEVMFVELEGRDGGIWRSAAGERLEREGEGGKGGRTSVLLQA